jgi:hypothetical protein
MHGNLARAFDRHALDKYARFREGFIQSLLNRGPQTAVNTIFERPVTEDRCGCR